MDAHLFIFVTSACISLISAPHVPLVLVFSLHAAQIHLVVPSGVPAHDQVHVLHDWPHTIAQTYRMWLGFHWLLLQLQLLRNSNGVPDLSVSLTRAVKGSHDNWHLPSTVIPFLTKAYAQTQIFCSHAHQVSPSQPTTNGLIIPKIPFT